MLDTTPWRVGGGFRRGFVVTAAVVATLVLVVVTVAMLLLPAASPRRLVTGALEAGDPAFYAVPTSTPAAPPGTVVRSEELLSVPDGSRAWRVLYHSTDPAGRDTVLSGIVVAPDSPAPAAGRAVVGWGHPTTGAAASCAPSNGVDPYLLVEGLPDLIRAGYVVVAPDYPGMGVPAPSSYLIGTSGRGASSTPFAPRMSYRPVRRPPPSTGATRRAATPSSSPHCRPRRMRRSSPSAPPQSPPRPPTSGLCSTTTSATSRESPSGRTPSRRTSRPTRRSTPGLELTSILTDAGAAVTQTMAGLCLFGDNDKLHALATPLLGRYLRSDPRTTEPWSAILAENTPGAPPAGLPVFVAQGGADTLVIPSATEGSAAASCRGGGRMTFRLYPTDTHGTIANTAMPDVLTFLAKGLAGTPAPSTR